ncbi:N-acetylglucosamine kinase [Fodinicola acaciae]|uniref:N-acetylglucosamine kinase n=1 Tax=Fodinicola acaciae TaxID=2681555 RepID=UPI0013D4FEA6|nr:BadF/BadG/BcrA/BcrD ATPase family protein [Fodinicola acaciae]
MLASKTFGRRLAITVIGIDIGATKTHLATGSGDVVTDERVVRTSTWRRRSPVEDATALARLVTESFGSEATKNAIAVGAHGCDTTEQCLDLQRQLRTRVTGPVRVVNDAELMPAAMQVPHAIGVVCGTGSIAVVRDAADQLVIAGGWGWVLGDEGSASGLVREAVRAVLADLDTGETSDPLTHRLLASFAVDNGPELAMALTHANSADVWGSYAGEVFAAAREGSVIAAATIADGGRQLAAVVRRLVDRGIPATAVVAGGSVIQTQPELREAFLSTLEKLCPRLTAYVLDRPPVVGALAIASGLA